MSVSAVEFTKAVRLESVTSLTSLTLPRLVLATGAVGGLGSTVFTPAIVVVVASLTRAGITFVGVASAVATLAVGVGAIEFTGAVGLEGIASVTNSATAGCAAIMTTSYITRRFGDIIWR